MEISRQRNFRDDRTSDCRSFGSNYHPCSQSRKISIGVMVDASVKTRPKTTKKDEAEVPTAEKVVSSKGNSLEHRNNGEGVMVAILGKQTEAPEQETSPWVSTRSFHQKTPTSEAVHDVKQTSNLPLASGEHNRYNGVKAEPTEYQFFANQKSILQSGDGKQKKFNRVTYRKKGGQDVTTERVEEFSFATAQEVLVSEKEVVEDKTNRTENRSSEALRMKLWEILGTVSSPHKQVSNSQAPEMGANNLNLERGIDQKGNPVVKPRQNSDTIESDSESPDDTIRRPVTRSLTRKRAPTKVKLNKIKNAPSSSYKRKHLEKNIFSFEEGWCGRLHGGVTGGSSMSKRKKSERKSFRTESRKICFPEKDSADDTQQTTDRSKTTLPAEKTSSLGNKIGGFKSFPPKNNSEFVEPENGIQKKDSHRSPLTKMTDQLGDINSPALPEQEDQREDFANPSLKSIVDRQYDHQSPMFEMRTPIKSSSPGSPPKTNQREPDDHSPAERVFNMEGICSFKSLLTSKPDYYKTNVETESSDDATELEDSPVIKSVPIMEEKDAENRLSKSSSEERDSESSEEYSPINEGRRETESLSPEIRTTEKPKFLLRPRKRLRSQEGIKVNGFSPTASPKGFEESNGFQGPSGQSQEDGLASAVALFALALERVKSKMKSVTSKKSAEILMSVAEGMHSQLQNAESQIQTDVGELTNLSKSKRKRTETRFQEQQEQLKLIHEKFKEEVNQHIQDCRSAIEGLEAHQIEFKGIVEKQKASHRKLLLQAEEAIETQLNDAQRRITAVQKFAREKMLQLKYVIAECLKEGVLS